MRNCNSCGLDRDPLNWFTEESPDTCLECQFNNTRVATMAIAFVGTIVAASAVSRQRQDFDPFWLKRTSDTVKKAIRKTAEVVSPIVAAEVRKKEDASNIPEQRWLLRQPNGCLHCKSSNMMFSEFDSALNLPIFSSLCKVCLILRAKHLEVAAKLAAKKVDDRKKLENVRFFAKERTRVEYYEIACSVCRKKFDPQKVPIVAAKCRSCTPADEIEIFDALHAAWTKHDTQPMRMM